MINILTIDWDYFVDSTIFQRAHFFPDGIREDMPEAGKTMIWNDAYAHSVVAKQHCGQRSIMEITANNGGEYTALCDLIKKYRKPDTRMSVHESHAAIVDIINRNFIGNNEINVFNIDSHHDCDTHAGLSEIDYGNWGSVLLHEKRIQRLYWVKREDSDDAENSIFANIYNNVQELCDNPSMLIEGIDYIFMCRSEAKTPPHLDNSFMTTALTLARCVGLIIPDCPDGLTLRWTEEIDKDIAYLTVVNQFTKEHLENKRKGIAVDDDDLTDKINQYCKEHDIEIPA